MCVWDSLQLGQNHKPIFKIQDESPTWPSDTDEFMGLKSISKPDDVNMDDNNNEEAQDDAGQQRRVDCGSCRFVMDLYSTHSYHLLYLCGKWVHSLLGPGII
jgi:hypothetical protein